MEYPEQTIKRLTQRLGRAPTPEEIKSERDMLIRAAYGSMLLAEISFADEVLRKQDGNCTILSPVKFMGAPKRHSGPIEED
jgi:DNA-directed RNA polymerase specialized sigma subunit